MTLDHAAWIRGKKKKRRDDLRQSSLAGLNYKKSNHNSINQTWKAHLYRLMLIFDWYWLISLISFKWIYILCIIHLQLPPNRIQIKLTRQLDISLHAGIIIIHSPRKFKTVIDDLDSPLFSTVSNDFSIIL